MRPVGRGAISVPRRRGAEARPSGRCTRVISLRGNPPSRPPASSERPTAIRSSRSATRCCFPMSVVPINVRRPRSVRLVEDLLGRERALVGVRQPALARRRRADVQGALHGRHRRPRGEGDPPRAEQLLGRAERPRRASAVKGTGAPRALHARARSSASRESLVRDVEARRASARACARRRARCSGSCRTCRATPPASSTTCASPAPLADLIASNFPQAQASRRRQAGDPRGLRRQGPRPRSCWRWSARQLEVLRVKKEISSMVQEEMGRVAARVHPPPAR